MQDITVLAYKKSHLEIKGIDLQGKGRMMGKKVKNIACLDFNLKFSISFFFVAVGFQITLQRYLQQDSVFVI